MEIRQAASISERRARGVPFKQAVMTDINAYFKEKKIAKDANFEMWFKVAFFSLGLITSWVLVMFGGLQGFYYYLAWISLGAFTAFVGFNVSHDAIHGSLVFKNNRVRKIFGLSFNLIGANMYVWEKIHNSDHHRDPNKENMDGDLNLPPLRLAPFQKHRFWHWFQPLYVIPVYCLSSMFWVFIKDFNKFFNSKDETAIK